MKCGFAYRHLKTVSEFKSGVEFRPRTLERSRFKIAVIDDNGFDKDSFSKTGFTNVTSIKTFDGPDPYAAYQIILCDIDGVGKAIDPKAQGIAVARTLKQIYPDKIVLLYSGKNPSDFSGDYMNSCDGFIAKDTSMSELATQLAEKCNSLVDPVSAWQRNAALLLQKGASYKAIAWLEDSYVDSLRQKTNKLDESVAQKLGIAADIVKLIISLINFFI